MLSEKEINEWLAEHGISVALHGRGPCLHYMQIAPVTEINLPEGTDYEGVPWVTVFEKEHLGQAGAMLGVIIYEYEH